MPGREWAGAMAAGILAIGLGAGCGGNSHTEFMPGLPVEVRVARPSLMMTVGSRQTVAASAYDDRGLVVPGVSFTWSAFNPAVATVAADEDGAAATVTAVAPGITSVSATHNGMVARIEITVTAGEVELSFDRDIKTLAALGCSCHQPGGKPGSQAIAMSGMRWRALRSKLVRFSTSRQTRG